MANRSIRGKKKKKKSNNSEEWKASSTLVRVVFLDYYVIEEVLAETNNQTVSSNQETSTLVNMKYSFRGSLSLFSSSKHSCQNEKMSDSGTHASEEWERIQTSSQRRALSCKFGPTNKKLLKWDPFVKKKTGSGECVSMQKVGTTPSFSSSLSMLMFTAPYFQIRSWWP